ncbi:MAG: response regulator [Candidatus Eremiobacteraeota bacterium]|nr:response regulator [Candidatus Eremiobacteraeota bacterium]
MEEVYRILVADDEEDNLNLLKCYLETMDFEVITAVNGIEAVEKAQSETPDLIILDVMMPGIDGFEACKKIRGDFSVSHIPILFLTCKVSIEDTVHGLNVGGDDYISKPFDFRELVTRIHTILRRTKQHMAANPLTGLPGNTSIQKEIKRLISEKITFAVCLLDIDNFKSFNDLYGYERGDKVIKNTATIIMEACKDTSIPYKFIGHIGGDDFIFICAPEHAAGLSEKIISQFDAVAPEFYDDKDRERGFIETISRRGDVQRYPLVSISIGIVTNELRILEHPGQVAQILAELKSFAKKTPGSNYVKDRRAD